jgi:hypothetical protein
MLRIHTFVQSTHQLASDGLQQPFITEELVMQTALKYLGALSGCAALAATLAFAAEPAAKPKQDKYTVKVPGGLGFAEFKGYESWQVVSVSNTPQAMAVILGNPAMIKAFEAGIPANGQPVPDGARMAKVHYVPKKHQFSPDANVPAAQHDVDFMVKDSKRFGDVGGWGYAVFNYDAASDTFTPGTTANQPPQANDAKCGVACHTIMKANDYVFTEYQHR